MGNYTPEQVERQAKKELARGKYAETYGMLRAYAATLRQQAVRVDEGAITRLREIAYRDEAKSVTVRADDLRAIITAVDLNTDLTAALAHGTQGGGEPVAWQRRIKHDSGKWLNWEYFSGAVDYTSPEDFPKQVGRWECEYRPLGVIHAERARVPDGWMVLPEDLWTHRYDWLHAVEWMCKRFDKDDPDNSQYWHHQLQTLRNIEASMAAAPSQRAESYVCICGMGIAPCPIHRPPQPKNAGEVES